MDPLTAVNRRPRFEGRSNYRQAGCEGTVEQRLRNPIAGNASRGKCRRGGMPPSAALIRYGGSGLPSQYTGAKLVLPKRSEVKKFLALESDRGRELPAIEASGRTL